MPRVVKDLGGFALLDDFSILKNRHPVAERPHGQQVVRDEQGRHVALAPQFRQQFEHFALGDHIEGAGRLIGNQQVRLMQERERDQHPLGLAQTDLAWIAL